MDRLTLIKDKIWVDLTDYPSEQCEIPLCSNLSSFTFKVERHNGKVAEVELCKTCADVLVAGLVKFVITNHGRKE